MTHPYSERWVPYKDGMGNVVTLDPKQWFGPFTSIQVRAILHAVSIVNEVRATQRRRFPNDPPDYERSNPPLHEDFPEKSRALGRLLIEGKPLFEEMPPWSMGAAAYWEWDAEHDADGEEGVRSDGAG